MVGAAFGSASGKVRVEGGVGGNEVRVEGVGSGEVIVKGVGSGEVTVKGGIGSCEVTFEGGIGNGEMRTVVRSEMATGGEGEPGSSRYSNQETVRKRRRLSAIGMIADEPIQSWLDHLPCDDLQDTALLLYTRLPAIFELMKTDAATVVGEILDKFERTIRHWVDDFVQNDGEFSDTQQGHYIRNNTLMSNEDICERARVYVQEKPASRGRPNLTANLFCQWVNNELLPNSVLEPGYPHRVSVEQPGNGFMSLDLKFYRGRRVYSMMDMSVLTLLNRECNFSKH